MEIINVYERQKKCNHSAKKIRKQGKIPGVLYTSLGKNFLFEVGELDFNKEVSDNGEFGVIDISFEGKNQKALIKQIQREPVNHRILHVDLESIDKDKIIQTEVPVKFSNEELINKRGAVIQKQKDKVKVRCSSDNIPKFININLNDRLIGNAIRIADVEFGEYMDFLEDPSTIIASINYNKKEEFDDSDDKEKIVE